MVPIIPHLLGKGSTELTPSQRSKLMVKVTGSNAIHTSLVLYTVAAQKESLFLSRFAGEQVLCYLLLHSVRGHMGQNVWFE